MLGNDRRLRLDEAGARARLADLGATLGVDVDPDTTTSDLSLGAQQQIEIVNALWRGSRLLILDEPTSMLTPQGFAELEKVITRLKANGLAVVFITHKLHEALALGDRVSILRQGRVVGSLEPERMRASAAGRAARRDHPDHVRRRGPRGLRHRRAAGRARRSATRPARRALADEVVLELEGVSARRHRRRARDRGDLAAGAPGRGARHRRRRRQRAARTGRGRRRAARHDRRRRAPLRGVDQPAERRAAPEARPPLRDGRPARRGHRRAR